jgi:hypothetical protein
MITEEELPRFRRIGFDEVLPKPVAAVSLVQRIDAFMAQRSTPPKS